MVIDLNRKMVTKEGLLQYIQDIDVYRFYTGEEVKFNTRIKSPLREEKDPSFGYFLGDEKEVCFNDYLLGGGDFIRFVELKFGLSFFEAMSKIAIDFNLTPHFIVKKLEKTSKNYDSSKFEKRDDILRKSNNFKLGKKRRPWKIYDLKFWKQYNIYLETLKHYKVEPIDFFFVNDRPILADKYAYAFIEHKDGKETYKIYQPFNKEFKWLNSHNNSIWQGWEQLPKSGKKLIITKSLKDVMSIYDTMELPAVSLQSEAVHPKENVMQELEERFEEVYLLYDNDFDKDVNWGKKLAEQFASNFNVTNIMIPDKYHSKDFSDLVKKQGAAKAAEVLEDLIAFNPPF